MRRAAVLFGVAIAAAAVIALPGDGDDAATTPRSHPPAASGAEPITSDTRPLPLARTALAAPADAGASVAGIVVDERGHPLAGAAIRFVIDRRDDVAAAAESGNDGRFALSGAPAAVVSLRIGAAGRATVQVPDLEPAGAPDRRLDVGTIVLAPAVRFRGRVRCEGRGLAALPVVLVPELAAAGAPMPLVQTVATADDGTFEFADAPAPPVTLRVEAPDHRVLGPMPVRVASAARLVEIELAPLPRLRGRAIDRDLGAAVAGAHVRLVARDADRDVIEQSETATDDDGAFDLPVRDGVAFDVHVSAAGHAPLVIGPLDRIGVERAVIAALVRSGDVAGTLTWGGDPIGGAVSLWDPGAGRCLASELAAPDGSFRLDGVPAGVWRLRVDPEQGARHERRVEVRIGELARVAIAIAAGTRLVGRVRGETPNAPEVFCVHEDGPVRRGPVQGDGTFEVEGLFEGHWTVHAASRERTWAATATRMLLPLLPRPAGVQIATAVAEVRCDVDAPGLLFGAVVGRVTAGHAGAVVMLEPLDTASARVPFALRRATVAADGSFAIEPVLPGTWRVAGPGGAAEIVVSAGSAAACELR